jgi:hypothetical protein
MIFPESPGASAPQFETRERPSEGRSNQEGQADAARSRGSAGDSLHRRSAVAAVEMGSSRDSSPAD